MSQSHKPLPKLPPTTATTTSIDQANTPDVSVPKEKVEDDLRAGLLSVEGRLHRASLIRSFLADPEVRKDSWLYDHRDSWAYALEDALDEFGRAMARGGWWKRIIIGRGVKAKMKLESSEETVTTSSNAGSSTVKPSAKESSEGTQHSRIDAKPLPARPHDPLKILQHLAAHSKDDNLPGHLVVCLTPHGRTTPLPFEDSGFDIIPANIGCQFSPGSYSLQDELKGSTVIFGLEDLPTSLLDAQEIPIQLIGGTFTFKGLIAPSQHALLATILRLALYTHLNLLLEQHVLRDSGVQLDYRMPARRPTLSGPSSSTPPRVLTFAERAQRQRLQEQSRQEAEEDSHANRSKLRTTFFPSSFTTFLSHLAPSTSLPSNNGGLGLSSWAFGGKGKASVQRSQTIGSPGDTLRRKEKAAKEAEAMTESKTLNPQMADTSMTVPSDLVSSTSAPIVTNRLPNEETKLTTNDTNAISSDKTPATTPPTPPKPTFQPPPPRFRRFSFMSPLPPNMPLISTSGASASGTTSVEKKPSNDRRHSIRRSVHAALGHLQMHTGHPNARHGDNIAHDKNTAAAQITNGDAGPRLPMNQALRCINDARGTLSTSIGVKFSPPRLVVELAQKETEFSAQNPPLPKPPIRARSNSMPLQPVRKLKGDERAALTSLIGFGEDGRNGTSLERRANEVQTSLEGVLSGMGGFVRFQGISVLWSEKVPCLTTPDENASKSMEPKDAKSTATATDDPADDVDPITSPAGTLKSPKQAVHKPDFKDFLYCNKPEWRSWRFFVSDGDESGTLSAWGAHSRASTSTSTNTNTSTSKSTPNSDNPKKNPSDNTQPPLTSANRPSHTPAQSQESNILRSHSAKPPLSDPRLGSFLRSLAQQRKEKCRRPGCSIEQGKHLLRAVHGGVGVEIWVREMEKESRVPVNGKGIVDTISGKDEAPKCSTDKETKAPKDAEVTQDDACEVPVPVKEEDHVSQIETVSDNKEKVPTDPGDDPGSHVDADRDQLEIWESCAVCGSRTVNRKLSDESSLFSFAKYLELLLYSPALCKLSPSLCSHTSLPMEDKSATNLSPELISIRYNIVRNFSHRSSKTQISFALSPVQDVYELQVPRLQIIRGTNSVPGTIGASNPPSRLPTRNSHQNNPILRGFVVQPPAQARKGDKDETSQKRILRKEIRRWWEGVADHIDQIENVLKAYEATHKVDNTIAEEPSASESDPERSLTPRPQSSKALPRLPSADSAYEIFDSLDDETDHSPEPSGVVTPVPISTGQQSQLSTSPSLSERSRTPTGSTVLSTDKDDCASDAAPAVIATPSPLNTPSALSTSTQNTSTSTTSTVPPSIPPKDNSEALLASLRYQMQTVEQNLYAQLARTPEAKLNDVRRSFLATGRGTQKRLAAWKRKHLGDRWKDIGDLGAPSKPSSKVAKGDGQSGKGKEKEVKDEVQEAKADGAAKSDNPKPNVNTPMEPEWWRPGCHVLPGGNIIVREDDWGSIISHTLSTSDYQLELANLSVVLNRAPSNKAAFSSLPTTPPLESPPTPGPSSSSFFSIGAGYNIFATSNKNQPDPDRADVVWNEPEEYSAVISRKDHVRDPASFLSIRGVLRQKAIAEVASDGATPTSQTPTGNRIPSSNSASASIMAKIQGHSATTPPPAVSVKAKPDVGLDVAPAGGELETPEQSMSSEVVGQILSRGSDPESVPPSAFAGTWRRSSRPPSVTSFEDDLSQANQLSRVDAHIERKKGSSVISLESGASDKTIGKETKEVAKNIQTPPEDTPGAGTPSNGSMHKLPPPLPPKGDREPASVAVTKAGVTTSPDPPSNTSSSITSTLANGLQSAMRYVMNSEPVSRIITPPPPPPTSSKKVHPHHHHGLLADISIIDDRPHIKYDWTVGKRLKFSCTVYYAKQFDTLRKRCGVSETFLQSLSQSANWTADGGKSKSNFWKTSDDKFIIKTLVNAWNVADLQVLIDHAPSYFQYMDSTASRPTVLAKLMGFYTVEIRNLETGNVQSRADLLVMENLFFDRNISKIFDLKGIQGRKVKARGKGSKTLFDGEWIEGQQRALTLIHPYSKVVLREALKHDADFLSKSNIMDYSLLVGVDEDKKEIACGLVDTIGSYTFAKTLEYKAKHNLQGGKEVTVIPPAEYRERFINALDGYFVACPDKWSKPLDHSQIMSDPTLLPNIC
ncbi:hypothetical protein CVT24_003691 [Panaeolus cyanescens]|uniref:PIPK domain-containing protein n=1 Tax=Panaeolus cyanescens TaxID=181874 RepID=A0A409VUL0_9AGAR|nr:hypothetical protein CVT24_003691 [Panaeolus cyanescens]